MSESLKPIAEDWEHHAREKRYQITIFLACLFLFLCICKAFRDLNEQWVQLSEPTNTTRNCMVLFLSPAAPSVSFHVNELCSPFSLSYHPPTVFTFIFYSLGFTSLFIIYSISTRFLYICDRLARRSGGRKKTRLTSRNKI